ncbi:MAG TPA: enolase C-terminal domain-like protein [Kofleriaceae bacterium]|jgi:L-alanine-DL-glutamate epimerase-like enolase superfamily enzyme
MRASPTARIERLDVRACNLATDGGPESDGTAVWDSTTMVIVQPHAEGITGLGYSYVAGAAAGFIRDVLAPAVVGKSAFSIAEAWTAMRIAARNHGATGLVAYAISAVDVALWDLKAKLVGVALADLLGAARDCVPVYASGGFTSESDDELVEELEGYVAEGHRRVKIKIGRTPEHDLERVRRAREAVGKGIELMVDANGAYPRKRALAFAEQLAGLGVVYFEEPVSADDLDGLRLLRDRAPAPVAIAAGEYGDHPAYFRHMLDAGAVDILQADATRALGITGFMQVDALCAAHEVPLSSHCAPAIHAHAGAAATRLVHLEHFRDHARMESMMFDGAPVVEDGTVAYDPKRPGLGLVLDESEARRHAA